MEGNNTQIQYSFTNFSTLPDKNLIFNRELFYVLGALLGDGCAYHWKKGNVKTLVLIGDYNFTKKYTEKLTKCSRNKVKNYIDRSKNIWFVRAMCKFYAINFGTIRH